MKGWTVKHWKHVDVRLLPDGTYSIYLWNPNEEKPTPLWTKEGEPCAPFERDFLHPMPMLSRSGITDPKIAIFHARAYDIYFGAREELKAPAYQDLAEYLEANHPKAFKILTDLANGHKAVEETKKPAERNLTLEGEKITKDKPKKAASAKKQEGKGSTAGEKKMRVKKDSGIIEMF